MLLLALLVIASSARSVPAFPGCEGFGCETPGGRGGRVIPVTSLADSGPGTLRAALEAEGPRTVVFRTAGIVTLERPIRVASPFLTVAGQTAPGSGLLVRNQTAAPLGLSSDSFQSIEIVTSDVVIRYLAVRPGVFAASPACTKADAIRHPKGWSTCDDANDIRAIQVQPGSKRIVLDHLSLAYATDETIALIGASDVTLSWSIVADGFPSFPYCGFFHRCDPWGGKGIIVGDDPPGHQTTRFSEHHNLWANVAARTPQLAGVTDARYSIVYNWREHGANIHNRLSATSANYVGNVMWPGPETKHPEQALSANDWTDHATQMRAPNARLEFFLAENLGAPIFCNRWSTPAGRWLRCRLADYARAEPVPAPEVSPGGDVLRDAGASRRLAATGQLEPRRDAHDERVVAGVRSRTGRAPRHDAPIFWPGVVQGEPPSDQDGDGQADEWERSNGFAPGRPDGHLDRDGDGFTNLEEFLNASAP